MTFPVMQIIAAVWFDLLPPVTQAWLGLFLPVPRK
jgi:hypothetical protein